MRSNQAELWALVTCVTGRNCIGCCGGVELTSGVKPSQESGMVVEGGGWAPRVGEVYEIVLAAGF